MRPNNVKFFSNPEFILSDSSVLTDAAVRVFPFKQDKQHKYRSHFRICLHFSILLTQSQPNMTICRHYTYISFIIVARGSFLFSYQEYYNCVWHLTMRIIENLRNVCRHRTCCRGCN